MGLGERGQGEHLADTNTKEIVNPCVIYAIYCMTRNPIHNMFNHLLAYLYVLNDNVWFKIFI